MEVINKFGRGNSGEVVCLAEARVIKSAVGLECWRFSRAGRVRGSLWRTQGSKVGRRGCDR